MDWVLLGQQVWYGLVNGVTYVVAAAGLTLVFGVLRIFNMAHGELAMLGALSAYTLMTWLRVHFLLAALLSTGIVSFLGLALNRMVLRRVVPLGPFSVVLSTMAVSFIISNGSIAIWGSHPRPMTIPFDAVYSVGGVRISEQSLALFGIAFLTMTMLHVLLKRTRFGKAARATSQNEIGARLVGIDLTRVYDYSVSVAAGLAALAGVLVAPIAAAHPLMGQELLVKGFVVCIVGGMGSVPGVVVTGVLLGILEAMFGQYISPLNRTNFIYALMIGMLLLRPQGLFGEQIRADIR